MRPSLMKDCEKGVGGCTIRIKEGELLGGLKMYGVLGMGRGQ